MNVPSISAARSLSFERNAFPKPAYHCFLWGVIFPIGQGWRLVFALLRRRRFETRLGALPVVLVDQVVKVVRSVLQ